MAATYPNIGKKSFVRLLAVNDHAFPLHHFTIRDLLWLTALVALAVGWGVDRRNVVVQRDQLAEKVANLEKLTVLQGQVIGL